MLSLKIRLALGVGMLLGSRLLAEPPVPDAQKQAVRPPPVALNASVQNGEIVGFEQFRRVFMSVGERRLMFVVPEEDFRADISDPEKVVLVNHDYTCVLSFRVATPAHAPDSPLQADICRGWLSADSGETTVLDEFAVSAANLSGPSFDLAVKKDRVVRSARVAFIASPVGILEFSVSASPEKFAAAKATFQAWLRGFRISDTQGQLKITPAVQGDS